MSTDSDHAHSDHAAGHPEMPTSIERMLRPERAATLDQFRVISHSPVNPRDTVVDVGCGPGYFTLPLAKFLINGKVIALDVSDEMIEACQSRLDEARMGNVEILKCDEYEFPVAPASVDGVFISVVLHHPSDRVRFLTAARQMLKPGGWCFIVEWQKRETESGPPQEVRITTDEIRQIAEDSGFRFQKSQELNTNYYMATLINS